MTLEQIKAKELKVQFGDNAKYVALEVLDELKTIPVNNANTFKQACPHYHRFIFWQNVKTILENK